MTQLQDPVVRTFRIPRDLYVRLGAVRGLESLNGEVVRRLEASFPRTNGVADESELDRGKAANTIGYMWLTIPCVECGESPTSPTFYRHGACERQRLCGASQE